MIKPLLVGTFVAVVVLTECLFAYFLIPSTADVEKWAKEKSAAHAGKGGKSGHDGHGNAHAGGEGGHGSETGHAGENGAHAHEIEVDLGKYNVVVHQPAANVTLRVNFHLIGTVPEEAHHEFEELLDQSQHRLRDQAIFEIRNCRDRGPDRPRIGLAQTEDFGEK